MKKITVNESVSHSDLVTLPKNPVGMITTSGVKFLLIFDSGGCYTYNRVDNLSNTGGYYLPPARYKTLTLLFEKESALGEQFVLFDSWKEFYLWCAQ